MGGRGGRSVQKGRLVPLRPLALLAACMVLGTLTAPWASAVPETRAGRRGRATGRGRTGTIAALGDRSGETLEAPLLVTEHSGAEGVDPGEPGRDRLAVDVAGGQAVGEDA
jgi:hypothetical protein